MNIQDIGVAVVGAGFIGPVHVEALKRIGVRITGIMDTDPKKAEQARQQLALPRAYTDFASILADDSVDSVHLAVPNVLHYSLAKQALQAGKHVMCEKPLAMNATESAELVALAKETGLAAGVCYNIRFYPLNLEARSIIQRGELGKVYSIVGRYVQDWLLYETDYNWRVLADQGGALRAVADIGTHWMDLITSITGLKVESVFADLQTVHPVRKRPIGEVQTFSGETLTDDQLEPVNITTEDSGAILLRLEGGARASLWVSQVTAGRKNTLAYEIAGAKQALAWSSEQPNRLWIGNRNTANAVLERDPGLVSDFTRPFTNYPGGHNEGFPDAFKQCFTAFYRAIADGQPETALYPTFEEGHHEVALCDAILQSHREQRWVSL